MSSALYWLFGEHRHLLEIDAASNEVSDLGRHEAGCDGREVESSNGAKDGDGDLEY